MPYSERLQTLMDAIAKFRGRLVCVVVHLNDTYLIDERPPRLPGFPRLIATIKALRKHLADLGFTDRLMVVHSGDFLGPSRIGKKDKGAAMIELLNRCGLSYCLIGNHEFDYKSANLIAQLAKAKFEILSGNVGMPPAMKGRALAHWPSTANPLVAVTGIVSDSVHRSFDNDWKFIAEIRALDKYSRNTRDAAFHVVLTHATRDQDRLMRNALQDAGRTVILGGHDHHIGWVERDDDVWLFKNRANLETVRVLLLLAGGDYAMQQLNRRYEELKDSANSPPIFNPSTVEALLEPLHAADANVFRDWIEADSHDELEGAVDESYFDDDPLPHNALARRLSGLPIWHSVNSHPLKYADFLAAEAADEQWVASVIASIKEPGDDNVLFDFSAQTSQLDARDEALRNTPTDFGIWVAECVRREAGADIAILNAGAFRCDTYLEPKLAKRDLLDAFLYDEPGPGGESPIIVIRMRSADIDALLAHGRTLRDEGGYPQVADRRDPVQPEHLVAISSYLLVNPKSIDGYVEALAALHSKPSQEIRDAMRIRILHQLHIVPAVVKQGAAVGYLVPPPAALQQDDVTTFTRLARNASDAFDQMIPYPTVTHAEWNAAFQRMFTDRTMKITPEVQNARDELTAFLYSIRHRDIPSFMRDIRSHAANWAHEIGYIDIFRAAVAAVPGLQTYRD